jgi:cyanophycinase
MAKKKANPTAKSRKPVSRTQAKKPKSLREPKMKLPGSGPEQTLPLEARSPAITATPPALVEQPKVEQLVRPVVSAKKRGALIIIGGREDKEKDCAILKEVVRRVGENGTLCVATVASKVGDELWDIYRKVFTDLGVRKLTHLNVVTRRDSVDQAAQEAVAEANAVFFTGGDQLRITSELGGTAIAERIHEIYETGGVIAGTSAGASVMGETMLVSGSGDASFRVGAGIAMAPGLGLVKNMLIDQHFAERGRIGRLLGATAHNPKYLGIGIDENTGIVVEEDSFSVIGAGAVYVLDAHHATDCNLSEAQPDTALSIFNVRFHLMSAGDRYDLRQQRPLPKS